MIHEQDAFPTVGLHKKERCKWLQATPLLLPARALPDASQR